MKHFRYLGAAALVVLFTLFASVGASKAVPLAPSLDLGLTASQNTLTDLLQPVHYRRNAHCHTRLVRQCGVRNIRRCIRWWRGRCTQRVWRREWRCRRVPKTFCHRRNMRVPLR